jgi:hypothetical protein
MEVISWSNKQRFLCFLLSCFLFCVFLAGISSVNLSAEELPTHQIENIGLPLPTMTDNWLNFDELWQTLQAELIASEADSAKQLSLLVGLQTEMLELKYLLQESTRLFQESDQALANERLAYKTAIQERDKAQSEAKLAQTVVVGLGVACGVLLAIVAWK